MYYFENQKNINLTRSPRLPSYGEVTTLENHLYME